MMYGIIGDVVAGECGEDGGPDGCVDGLVFLHVFGFELVRHRSPDHYHHEMDRYTLMI